MPPTVPQFRLPLTLTPAGDFATVEQGGTTDLVQRVAVLCCTPPGTVDGLPDQGLYDQAFLEGGADIAEIERQITTYVPGAEYAISEDPRAFSGALAHVNVQIGER